MEFEKLTSEQEVLFTKVADLALELLGDAVRAEEWMRTRSQYLGGISPLSALQANPGADRVIESLYAIAFGGIA